jgi:lipopolysaccharide/colanic/teichoic acid biosynthesis glycosyltransferase
MGLLRPVGVRHSVGSSRWFDQVTITAVSDILPGKDAGTESPGGELYRRATSRAGALGGEITVQATADIRRFGQIGRLVGPLGAGLGVLLTLLAVGRVPPDVGVALLAAAAAGVAAGLQDRPDVVVVGDAGFCQRVLNHTGGARRIRATWVVDPDGGAWGAGPVVFGNDEVVVDGRILRDLRERAPQLVTACALRVVEHDQDPATVFLEPMGRLPRWTKRGLDVVFSLVLGLVAIPVLAAAILAIKIDSRGPGFFVQTRLGENGRRFRMLKLRTMAVVEDDSAERAWLQDMVLGLTTAESGLFKPPHSRRITRVGRVLRRLSLDEVPQLWNVLRGDMSLVGPRPPLDDEAAVYDAHAWQRLRCRPGLTGLSQISGRSKLCFSQIVDLDRAYLEHWSPWLEVKILLKTPVALVSTRGAG